MALWAFGPSGGLLKLHLTDDSDQERTLQEAYIETIRPDQGALVY